MRKQLYNILLIFLACLMVFISVPYAGLPVHAEENGATEENAESTQPTTGSDETISRAEWLTLLAETFTMVVEDDYYPDNYFSDLDSSSEYYYAVLLNVEFGVVDVETGGEVRPNDPTTREFAAHTLNYCLGYQVDESMAVACSDMDTSEYKDDLCIAINRGWFTLVEGNVLPEQNVTPAEADAMIADAEAVLAAMEVDIDAFNSFELADDVIAITKECDSVSTNDADITTVVVTGLQENIAVGNRFAVYQNDLPTVYIAETVVVENGITTITAIVDESEDAFTAVDAEGVVSGSVADIKAINGAELVFVDEETEEQYDSAEQMIALYGARSEKLFSTTAVVTAKLDGIEGVSGEVEVKLKNAKITYDVSARNLTAYAYLECDTEVSFKCNCDLDGFSPVTELPIVEWTVPGIGGFEVIVDLDLKVSASGVQKGYLKTGVSVSAYQGVRMIYGFQAKSFSLVAKAQADLGVEAKLGITKMPLLKAYVYAKVGGKAEASRTEWVDEKLPHICVDFSAYIYAKCGATGKFKFLAVDINISVNKDIVDKNNSPIRCVKHYDDGVEVTVCGRDAATEEEGSDDTSSGEEAPVSKKSYVTPANSSWSGSYWANGTPSAGTDDSGNVIPMFEYSVNKDGETVTITKYNGNATSLIIPDTLDGKKVTAIGSGVFQDNTKLRTVSISDNVTSIRAYAFNNCTKLESVKLPGKLETMARRSFGNCDMLTSIRIPKSLTVGGNVDGAFAECSGLKNVTFEEGATEIAEYLFNGCDGLEKIEIPNSVTKIELSAFGKCSNLKEVTFSSNLTTIDRYAFEECTSLQKIELPDSVTSIGAYAFNNCTKLEAAKLPKNLVKMENNMFSGCIALTTVQFPETITTLGDDVFNNCDSLVTVSIPESVVSVGLGSFYDCDALTAITIPKAVEKIGNYAFYDCDQLQNVTLPDSLTSLGDYVFQDCNELTDVKLGLGLNSIPAYTFADCGKLATIVIPYNVTNIKAYTFKNCPSLVEITIPQKTTSISTNAFSYPGKMTVYGVSGSYAQTYANQQGMTFVDKSVPAQTVAFSEEVYSLNKNSTIVLKPTITPADFTDLISWKSSNTSVATVDENGVVKGVGLGTATIKVTVGNVSGGCKVTVVQPVTSISLNRRTVDLEALQSINLTATVYPSNANNRNVEWSSSDEEIATVSQSGEVTAYKKGSCIITASATDGSGVKATCTVNVKNNVYVVDDINYLQSSHPYENNCTDIWQYTLSGAESLEVSFTADTYVEDGFDYIYVFDGKNNQIGKYTGNELSEKTIEVEGDTVRISLVSDNATNGYGFKVKDVKEKTQQQIDSFVTRMYEQCLSRDPDQAGLEGWAGQLENGNMNGADIAQAFVFSNEMLDKNLSDAEFVKALYRSMMGREADEAGLNGWVSQLQGGYLSRSEVTEAFVESTEFTGICTEYGITRGDFEAVGPIERFVTRFYNICLGREADQKGHWGWVVNLRDKHMNGAQIAEAFFFSEEFINKNVSDEAYVDLLYRTIMGREPDEAGKSGWVNELKNGYLTRKDMLKAFIESTEFTGLCAGYGIERGSL